jgi:predicted PurR-regulated permease PerM
MNEETGITVLGALGIIAAVVLAVVLIRHLLNQQNPGPPQLGQSGQPIRPE